MYLRAPAGAPKAQALAAFNAEVSKRAEMDAAVRELVNQLLANSTVLSLVQVRSCGGVCGERGGGRVRWRGGSG